MNPQKLEAVLQQRFALSQFRPSQRAVCEDVVQGHDVLLVMPTGAGKSLCYQLPGIVRGGTTLVISPLLALIDDQVQKLQHKGFKAEAIHSGKTREQSRAICIQYLRGELDFLYFAPERLGIPGFAEMLAKRPPSLIAIDEAHCISQWGHDFRPDYRLIGPRLARLRVDLEQPVPIIALTATATPLVQDDIIELLEIPKAKRSIQGFRRTNIAIESHEVTLSDRARVCAELLQHDDTLPAIIYAPTRKLAEEIAKTVKAHCYHAGLSADVREKVQRQFLSGESQIIVATIAFGMGIDKSDIRTVIHAGLSGSVEGYYQEIGRAGRDGKPSKAVLLHHFVDQKTHQFFLERDYPKVENLERIYIKTPTKNQIVLEDLRSKIGTEMEDDIFQKSIEKLLAHRGIRVTSALGETPPTYLRGESLWRRHYEKQRRHREAALDQMSAFAKTTECRMKFFLNHFGDSDAKNGNCGQCDRCYKPEKNTRPLTDAERTFATLALATLAGEDGLSVGRLFEEVTTAAPRSKKVKKLSRREFELILDALDQSGYLSLKSESFEKLGKTIHYKRVSLDSSGPKPTAKSLAQNVRITQSL